MTLSKVKEDLQKYFLKQSKFSKVDFRLISGIENRRFTGKNRDQILNEDIENIDKESSKEKKRSTKDKKRQKSTD